ncbi:MAG: NAD(P)/FAD-dependent oxidoreductase [Nonlabens sp.]|uniref:NAD(P)/FAD-dependent oxidoreductase n=1 Tax=Nonlabens sp. TaxID=1888209 RepID=UPI003EFAC492
MKDVLIIGSGIAACSLAWQLHEQGKSFVIITDLKKGSSDVAAGVYNPMVLKRFTAVWKAQEQLHVMNQMYDHVSAHIGLDCRTPITIARRFHDVKESNTWVKKSSREDLCSFMNSKIQRLSIDGIEADSGYGFVNGTGWVDATSFMKKTLRFFDSSNNVLYESFDNNLLQVQNGIVNYKAFEFKNLVFAEGYRMLDNPYFNHLPLQGNKGEVLIVKIPGLKLDHIIKSSVFLMPFKDDLFWVGATYDRDDLEDTATFDGREFLTSRLERFMKLPYEIVDHKHGIRPTTMDRRPFVGHDASHKNLWIFNGMGSRAVLLAPWAANQMINRMFNDEPLNPEIDIARFM